MILDRFCHGKFARITFPREVLVSQYDPLSRGPLVVDDYELDALSKVDGEIPVTSTMEHRHVPRILAIVFERLRCPMSCDERLHSNVTGMELFDCAHQTNSLVDQLRELTLPAIERI